MDDQSARCSERRARRTTCGYTRQPGSDRNAHKDFWPNRVPAKYSRHLQGPLWEFRLKGRDGIARALYVTAERQTIIILRVFAKKTQKTPRREIEIALERAKEAQ